MLIILTQVPKHFNSMCLLSWLRSSLLDTAFGGSNENTSLPYSDLSKLELLFTTSLKTVAYTPFMMLEIQDGRVDFRPRTSIHLSFTPEKRRISSYFYLSHAPHLDTSRRDCANVARNLSTLSGRGLVQDGGPLSATLTRKFIWLAVVFSRTCCSIFIYWGFFPTKRVPRLGFVLRRRSGIGQPLACVLCPGLPNRERRM